MRARRLLLPATIVAVGAFAMLAAMRAAGCEWMAGSMSDHQGSIPIGILGDSDSHSYQDRVWIPDSTGERGGSFRDVTLQWTDVLATLRPDQVDLGAFGIWGGRTKLSHVFEWLGVATRCPRKQDREHNFAFSGAKCGQLNDGIWRQAPRLVALMDRDPQRWRNGAVIVRIGINDLGNGPIFQRMAEQPDAPDVVALADGCRRHIERAIATIRARHAQTWIVIVGLFDNADCPPFGPLSAVQCANLQRRLDAFNGALAALAAADPRIVYFDDQAWFASHWGTRLPDGGDGYRSFRFAGAEIVHGAGDHPRHSVLADRHAGLVWNARWAQSMSRLLAERCGLPIDPLTDDELERLVRPALARPQ